MQLFALFAMMTFIFSGRSAYRKPILTFLDRYLSEFTTLKFECELCSELVFETFNSDVSRRSSILQNIINIHVK